MNVLTTHAETYGRVVGQLQKPTKARKQHYIVL